MVGGDGGGGRQSSCLIDEIRKYNCVLRHENTTQRKAMAITERGYYRLHRFWCWLNINCTVYKWRPSVNIHHHRLCVCLSSRLNCFARFHVLRAPRLLTNCACHSQQLFVVLEFVVACLIQRALGNRTAQNSRVANNTTEQKHSRAQSAFF